MNWFILSKLNQTKQKLRRKQMEREKVAKFKLRLAHTEDWQIAKNRRIKLEWWQKNLKQKERAMELKQ